RRLRASPMPHGTTTVAGQSGGGIVSGGTMLRTKPLARIARSAATLVAGLPQPLTSVMPRLAKASPASAASSNGRPRLSAAKYANLRSTMGVVHEGLGAPVLLRARDAGSCRITPQFSGGALSYEPWHFIHHRPLQLLVRRHADTPTVPI